MNRLIINIDPGDISHSEALSRVQRVVEGGLVSEGTYGDQYCFHTVFKDGTSVSARLNKSGSHTFAVWPKGVEVLVPVKGSE